MTTSTPTFYIAQYKSFGNIKYGTWSSVNSALNDLGEPSVSTEIHVESYDQEYEIKNWRAIDDDGEYIDYIDNTVIHYDRTEEDDWDDILLAF
jgi:hypothetical protein